MSETGRQLLEKALRLPEQERARLASELLRSLEREQAPEQEQGLIDALDELERGEGIPAERVYAELREVIERHR